MLYLGVILATDPACARLGRLLLGHQGAQCLRSPQSQDQGCPRRSKVEQNVGFILSLSKSWANVFVTFYESCDKTSKETVCTLFWEVWKIAVSSISYMVLRFCDSGPGMKDTHNRQRRWKGKCFASQMTKKKKERGGEGEECRCMTYFLQLGSAS